MLTEDIFNKDPFRLVSVLAAIEATPAVQTIIGDLNLFRRETSVTPTVRIEYRDGLMGLLTTKARGSGQGDINTLPKARVRTFEIPHLPKRFTITADELPSMRSWDKQTQVTVTEILGRHISLARAEMDATLEYHRIGALKGVITDPNGDVILNLWNEFNVVQEEIGIDFDSPLSIRKSMREAQRYLSTTLGQITTHRFVVLCGANFYDSMIDSEQMAGIDGINIPDQRLGEFRRNDYYQVNFGVYNAVFIPYEAQVGGVPFLEPDEAIMFPTNIPGLFRDIVGPCDTFAKRVRDFSVDVGDGTDYNTKLEYRAQTNRLQLVTRPKLIVKLTMEGGIS